MTGLRTFLSGEQTAVQFLVRQPEDVSRAFNSFGGPVHYIRPEQNLPALRIGLNALGIPFSDDHELLHAAFKLFRPDFEKQVRKLAGRDAAEIHFRDEPKSLSRMWDKETDPRERDVASPASHTDVDGVQIYARNIQSFIRITNKLRPSNNAQTLQMKEKAINAEDTGFPANTFKYVLIRKINWITVPWVVEILGLIDGTQEICKQSHKGMGIDRAVQKWFSEERRGVGDVDVLTSTAYIHQRAVSERPSLNREMAIATGLDKLRQTRTYFLIDDVPITHATDKMGADFCFVPDPTTGLFREENSYLGRLDKQLQISREDFIFYSRALVSPPDARLSGVVSTPALVSKIA